jgi:hypothetical protein
MTNNDQTPADIAGDLNNYRSLKVMVKFFKEKEDDKIMDAFLDTSLINKFEPSRFSDRFTRKY